MSELEFPEIETAEAATSTALAEHTAGTIDLTKIDLQAVALAGFTPARTAIATATKTLAGVVHDLSTPTKLADAKSLRNRLIKVPLAEARATSSALKSKLTKVSKAVGEELATIEAEFDKADALITPQIEKREAELAEERRIAAEKEAARVQAHRDNLAKLAGYAEHARGLPSSRIANGIEQVRAIVIDPAAWEEFAAQAEEQKAVTLERMQKLHADALADEERQRAAEVLRAEKERLDAERAEIERQREELRAQQEAAAAAERIRAEEASRLEREQQAAAERAAQQNSEAQAPQHVLKAEPATADATDRGEPVIASPVGGPMGAGQPAAAGPAVERAAPAPEVRAFPAPTAEAPTMTLGALNARLGFAVSADFLTGLGFIAHKDRAARLYRPSDFPAICRSISGHLRALASESDMQAA